MAAKERQRPCVVKNRLFNLATGALKSNACERKDQDDEKRNKITSKTSSNSAIPAQKLQESSKSKDSSSLFVDYETIKFSPRRNLKKSDSSYFTHKINSKPTHFVYKEEATRCKSPKNYASQPQTCFRKNDRSTEKRNSSTKYCNSLSDSSPPSCSVKASDIESEISNESNENFQILTLEGKRDYERTTVMVNNDEKNIRITFTNKDALLTQSQSEKPKDNSKSTVNVEDFNYDLPIDCKKTVGSKKEPKTEEESQKYLLLTVNPVTDSQNINGFYDLNNTGLNEFSITSDELFRTEQTDPFALDYNADHASIPSPVPSPKSVEIYKGIGSSESFNLHEDHVSVKQVEKIDCADPDPEQIDAIAEYLLEVEKERVVDIRTAGNVITDLKKCFRLHLDGVEAFIYGSYYSQLATSTSNINICLKADISVRKSFWLEVHKVLSKYLDSYHVLPFEEGDSPRKTKISFIEPYTDVECELAYLGRSSGTVYKMANLFKDLSGYDKKVKTLLIAVKFWAEVCCMDEFKEGKLHPIGFLLLMVHYLQHCEKPLLPVLEKVNREFLMEKLKLMPKSNVYVGELWLGFLKYYALTFNWKEHVVTITDKVTVPKSSRRMERAWMVIEDPFTKSNIAETVKNLDTANAIHNCFIAFYAYLPSLNEDYNCNISAGKKGLKRCKYSFRDVDFSVLCSAPECEECGEDGTCGDCIRKEYLPVAEVLPTISADDDFLKKVDQVLLDVYEEYMLSDTAIKGRRAFVADMEKHIQQLVKGAKLSLFGSSVNGFGFKKSDLDISMTIKNSNESFELKQQHQILRTVRKLLRMSRNYEDVNLLYAQIPIVNFRCSHNHWKGDISLGNSLAVCNTELLRTYSLIDKRCRILGCALKLLTKKTQLASTVLKGLSSYSYLIMVIFFLQQVDPPILPVLQDYKLITDQLEIPDEMVEGWNAWFYKDIENLSDKYDSSINKKTAGQLWIEMLDFYANFDYNRVISIRQKEYLPVEEKQSRARLFNIEDPFILSKNLGRSLSESQGLKLQNVLRQARQLFGNPKHCPKEMPILKNFFFSTSNLTGLYQAEKECNICGQFDHNADKCQSHTPASRTQFGRPQNFYHTKHFFHR